MSQEAKRAVAEIVADIRDRRGLKWEWDRIANAEIYASIAHEWETAIDAKLVALREAADVVRALADTVNCDDDAMCDFCRNYDPHHKTDCVWQRARDWCEKNLVKP